MKNELSFDVVVIGGGHAGCEAAAASARLGVNTALFTHKFETSTQRTYNMLYGIKFADFRTTQMKMILAPIYLFSHTFCLLITTV